MRVFELDDLNLNLKNLRPVDDQKSILTHSTLSENQETVYFGIPTDRPFYHQSYLKYLEIAWQCHCPIVITPDIVWYTMMNELSAHIRGNTEHYKSSFADPNAEGKSDILVLCDDPRVLEVENITSIVEQKCPTDAKLFYPEFSTSTVNSRLAIKATFLEAVSPWYNYMMYMCGIPRVRVEGTEEDWKLVIQRMSDISTSINALDSLKEYYKKLTSIVHKIIYNTFHSGETDWWSEIFYLQNCGSGSDVEVKGWFTDMFISKPKLAKIENFPTHVPSVPYTIVPNNEKYSFHVGLFSSIFDNDGFMVPDFGFISNKYKA